MKTTRNTTQNAFRWPCHILLGTGPAMTLKEAYQPLSHTLAEGNLAMKHYSRGFVTAD